MGPPISRPHHRRRHRKKLRLGEFAELGFVVRAVESWQDAPGSDPFMAFFDYQGWCFEGERAPIHGFASRFGGGSLTEVDRELMRSWLIEQGCTEFFVGELQDHWDWVTQ